MPAALAWTAASGLGDVESVVEVAAHDPSLVADIDADLDSVNAAPSLDDPGVIEAPIRADMVTATWAGDAAGVYLRARGGDGSWSQWTELAVVDGEGPDPETEEGQRVYGKMEQVAARGRQRARSQGRSLGGGRGHVHDPAAGDGHAHGESPVADAWQSLPMWVGDATHLQLAARDGHVDAIEVTYVNSSGTARASDRAARRVQQTAAQLLGEAAPDAAAAPSQPAITRRSGWGANESLRRGNPSYATRLVAGTVHHTVNANSYACSQGPALVRSIYASHISQGWNDIGYNFLGDRCGRIYEGRFGGIDRPVIGAHALGFNTGTVGVAVIGNFQGASPTSASTTALRNLLSWRLDVDHVNPVHRFGMRSQAAANTRYPAGAVATVHGVFGHQDVFATACPGTGLSSQLSTLRSQVWSHGGAKLARPRQQARSNEVGQLTDLLVQADGNRTLSWELRVERIDTGQVLLRRTASGRNFSSRWDGQAGGQRYESWNVRWRLNATAGGSRAREYVQRVGSAPPPPLEMRNRGRSPALMTPTGDGVGEVLQWRWASNVGGTFSTVAVDAAGIQHPLETAATYPAGTRTFRWNGELPSGPAADGRWFLQMTGTDTRGNTATARSATFVIDRTLGLGPIRRYLAPTGNRRNERLPVRVRVTGATPDLDVRIVRGNGRLVEVLHSGPATDLTRNWVLGRTTPSGSPLPDGNYDVVATATSATTPTRTLTRRHRFTVDTRPPRIRRAVARPNGFTGICTNEPIRVRGRIRIGNRVGVRTTPFPRGCSGTRRMPNLQWFHAIDAAGNVTSHRTRRR